jgi:hypothetical protein
MNRVDHVDRRQRLKVEGSVVGPALHCWGSSVVVAVDQS